MATADTSLRQRTTIPAPAPASPTSTSTTTTSTSTKSPSHTATTTTTNPTSKAYILLEVLRALAGLTILTAILSYLLTSGSSLLFNQNALLASLPTYFSTPLLLTPSTLSLHNGTAPTLPIYISLNRTIYDVSASPHIYGPGGMYSIFGGRDASRAFVTGCFDPVDDLVPDLEGVEEVFVPLWLSRRKDAEVEAEWDEVLVGQGGMVEGRSAAGLIADVRRRLGEERVEVLRVEAYEEARVQVQGVLGGWKRMLEGKGYRVVGRLEYPEKGASVEEEKGRVQRAMGLGFCKDALGKRPGMVESLTKALAALVGEGAVGGDGMANGGAGTGKVEDSKARDAIKEQMQRGHVAA